MMVAEKAADLIAGNTPLEPRMSRSTGMGPVCPWGAPGPEPGDAGRGVSYLMALLSSATIFFSSTSVRSVSANEVGHIAPWSRVASSLKPKVA